MQPQVSKKEIGHGVVGDENVHQPVSIQIQGNNSQRFGIGHVDARLLAHVGEGQVSIISVEDATCSLECRWRAGIPFPAIVFARRIILEIDVNVAADEKVQPAVIVVVEKGRARAEVGSIVPIRMIAQPGSRSNILESPAAFPVADIVVQNVGLSVTSEKKIGPAVIVNVANGHSHPATHVTEAYLLRDIAKMSVAEILE